MQFFSNLTGRLWDYISPRKTQKRRDKPFKVPALPPSRKLNRQSRKRNLNSSMSPATRVDVWKVQTPSSSIEGSVFVTHTSPTPSFQRLQSEISLSDLDGETLLQDSFQNANDETIVVDTGDYDPKQIDLQNRRERMEEKADDLRELGWPDDMILLFSKLYMRGYEAMIPLSWSPDFESFPQDMFTRTDDAAFINAAHGREFRAIKALRCLIDMGPRVRDIEKSPSTHRTPEQVICQAANKYLKWALEDGKFDQRSCLPVIVTEHFSMDMLPTTIEDIMLKKMERLADDWRDFLRIYPSVEGSTVSDQPSGSSENPETDEYVHDLPTIYGLVCSNTWVGFVAYDPMSANPTLEDIGSFDIGLQQYDVWNSLAIAILIIHCRNQMMNLKQYIPTTDATGNESDDPDA